VLAGRNLVYSASTSAGKSLVAEVLMLRRVLTTGKPVMLVLPYKALCAEKAAQLEALLEPMKRTVKHAYGGLGERQIFTPETGGRGRLRPQRAWHPAAHPA
jgi:DNA polymerase theta